MTLGAGEGAYKVAGRVSDMGLHDVDDVHDRASEGKCYALFIPIFIISKLLYYNFSLALFITCNILNLNWVGCFS